VLVLRIVDAIIGLHHLGEWYPDKVDTVRLEAEEIQRIGAGQAGILSHSKHIDVAENFKNFLVSDEGQAIFAKYHYFATAQQAFAWIGAKKPVGGERPAANWLRN
jgi:molybdate transport system substrate-binding protein